MKMKLNLKMQNKNAGVGSATTQRLDGWLFVYLVIKG